MKEIQGIIPIAATPFTDKGAVDEDSFQQMVRYLIQQRVHGITLFGIASEAYKLSDSEKQRLTSLLLKETTHTDVLSIVSISDHALEPAVINAKNAERAGANAIMILPPFFLQPSPDAIIEHIRQVASSVSIPVIIQYAPNQTGVRLQPEMFIQLQKQYQHIQCIKVETQPPGKYISQLLQGSSGKLKALVGYAGIQMPDTFHRGAQGVQPGSGSIEIYLELYKLYQSGKTEQFHQLFKQFLPYITYWMQGIELTIKATKTVLQKRGIIATDYCRQPGYQLDELELEMIDRYLEEFMPLLGGLENEN